MSTAAPMAPRERATDVVRFDTTERVLHWVTAVLGLTLIVTGLVMYAGPFSELVGRRGTVRTVHVAVGLVLPIPLLVAFALPRRGASLRADVRRLNRFDAEDRAWIRPRTHARAGPGKFNAGQKLNAAFLAAAGVVLFGSGVILHWSQHFAVDLRTGATFVHDWFAIGVWFAIFGHIVFALRDANALRGMVTGRVSARWARAAHPRWRPDPPANRSPESPANRSPESPANPTKSAEAPR